MGALDGVTIAVLAMPAITPFEAVAPLPATAERLLEVVDAESPTPAAASPIAIPEDPLPRIGHAQITASTGGRILGPVDIWTGRSRKSGIIALDDGVVAERGTHDELIETSDRYRGMWGLVEGSEERTAVTALLRHCSTLLDMSHVDWPLAVSVASNVAGRYPLEDTYHQTRLELDMPELVARASALVTEETGLEAPGFPDVAVIGRSGWVENNIASFSVLLAPAEERLGKQTGIGSAIAGRIMGAEMGAVLGFLSRRVLGQYELVLPTADGEDGDTVLFVGPNLLKMERDHAFRSDEFRFWVALHECTHRLQFMGVPWLRGYFLGLVEELVAATKPESGRIQRLSTELREAAANGLPLIDEAGIFGLFATPEQREIVDRVQALMALLEGHGHVVMDRIGERELVTQGRMSSVLKARRADKRTAALMRLIGLEMKLRQYEMGAEFIGEIERRADWATLDHAWESPDSLPTLEEIENPQRWLNRIA